jgi:hypothetical protein
VGDGAAVLGEGPQQGRLVEGELEAIEGERLAAVALAQRLVAGVELGPGKRRGLLAQLLRRGILGGVVNVVARVDRVEGVAGGDEGREVGDDLHVVGVGAPRVAPALLEDAPEGVVHHLLRGAAGAGVLAHRLLAEDRGDLPLGPGGAEGLDVAGRRQAHAVAEAEGALPAEGPRREPGQPGPQGRRVLRRAGADG